jgi:hypothetical protein
MTTRLFGLAFCFSFSFLCAPRLPLSPNVVEQQMAVHPRYRGYLCFQFRGKLYFYKVCPFGAVVSAHFWSRLGGVFQRLFHRMCYLPHASFLYVDDLLMFQESSIVGLSAAVIAVPCMLTRLPISW